MDRVGDDGPVPAHQIALEVQLVDVAQLREGVHPLLVELADGAMRGVHPARIRLQVVDLPRHELRGILLPVPVGRVVRAAQAAVAALRVQAARVHAELHTEVVHLYSSHKAVSSRGPARVMGFFAHGRAMQTARWQRHHSIQARVERVQPGGIVKAKDVHLADQAAHARERRGVDLKPGRVAVAAGPAAVQIPTRVPVVVIW